MSSKDMIISLFEAEKLDVTKFTKRKYSELFDNKQKSKFLAENNKEGKKIFDHHKSKAINYSYKELCGVQKVIKEIEESIYDKYPSNPFLVNTDNKKIYSKSIFDCKLDLDDNLTFIKNLVYDPGTTRKQKKDLTKEMLGRWNIETEKYIAKEYKKVNTYIDTNYIKSNYYINFKHISLYSLLFKMLISIYIIWFYISNVDKKNVMFSMIGLDFKALGFIEVMIGLAIIHLFISLKLFRRNKRFLYNVDKGFNSINDNYTKQYKRLVKKPYGKNVKLKKIYQVKDSLNDLINHYTVRNNKSPYIKKYKRYVFIQRISFGLVILSFIIFFINLL